MVSFSTIVVSKLVRKVEGTYRESSSRDLSSYICILVEPGGGKGRGYTGAMSSSSSRDSQLPHKPLPSGEPRV